MSAKFIFVFFGKEHDLLLCKLFWEYIWTINLSLYFFVQIRLHCKTIKIIISVDVDNVTINCLAAAFEIYLMYTEFKHLVMH